MNENYSSLNTIQLEACTVQHFSATEQIAGSFESMGMGRRLCPPLNYSFTIFGK